MRIQEYPLSRNQVKKMNLSLTDIKEGLLQVPKSTLAADTRNNLRPSLNNAASAEIRKNLLHLICRGAEYQQDNVELFNTCTISRFL